MRKIKFASGSYYHLCNRSNDEQPIFLDERDYTRFLFFILFCQSPVPFFNISRQISYFVRHSVFNIPEITLNAILAKRYVEINAFAIMPNHFHICAQQKSEGGISRYLQRIQDGYARYFNAKYGKRGHLFQGPFRAVSVETNEQLLYLSAYIHRNPRSIAEWRGKELKYPWSSYQDCVQKNRWSELLQPSIFLNQFANTKSYGRFIETSTAKLKAWKIPQKDLLLE